jgi:hypothetical protein
LKKIIGWAKKNRVDRETRTTGILLLGLGIALTIKPRSHHNDNDTITCKHAIIGKKIMLVSTLQRKR